MKDFSNLSRHKDVLSFNATIPYELMPWSEGQIFEVKNSDALKKKVFSLYSDFKKSYETQKGDNYVKNVSKGLFNLYQASYFTKEEGEDYLKSIAEFINEEPTKLEPIENYKLVICGGGKLIGLKRIDGHNCNEGVIRRVYTEGGKQVPIDDILFYQPKGKDDLEVIWYMNFVKPANL